MTSRPCAAMDTARLADTVVLPTPPLPPVTAITLTGREALSSARVSAWAGDSRMSRMGLYSTEIAREVGFVAFGWSALLQRQSGGHQPHPLLVRRVHILRHPLPVA